MLLLLLACPEPPADASNTSLTPPPTAGDVAAPPPPEGATAPAGDGPPPGGEAGAPPPGSPAPLGPPTALSALVADGPTAKLTVKVNGADSGAVDFLTFENGAPKVVAQQKVDKFPATLDVPAKYDGKVWVSVFVDKGTPGPDPSDLIGGSAAAITFGKDTEVSIDVGTDKAMPASWPLEGQRKGNDGPPPGAAPAAGAPPAGAPAGAPPAGAAPAGAPAPAASGSKPVPG